MSVFLKTIASLSIIGLNACAHFHADAPSTNDYSAEEVDVFDPTELVEELERVIEQADEAEKIIEYYREAGPVTGAAPESMGVEMEDLGVGDEN